MRGNYYDRSQAQRFNHLTARYIAKMVAADDCENSLQDNAADTLVKMGKPNRAAVYLEKYKRLNREYLEKYFYTSGLIRFHQGRFNEAEDSARKAVKISPYNVSYSNLLSSILGIAG